MSVEALLVVALGLGLGAMCKGVTGMGLPLLAMPILASYFDMPHAIAVMMVPGAVSNAWQAWSSRKKTARIDFLPRMVVCALIGIALGTVLLKTTPGPILHLVFALMLLAYVALRLLRPGFVIPIDTARRISAPTMLAGGILQGAVGVAAPIMVTFFNAVRFERHTYIHVIAVVYFTLATSQLAALHIAGLMQPAYLLQGLFALIPVALFMPLGAFLGRYVSERTFDRMVVAILFVMALRFFWSAATGLSALGG